MYPIRSTLPVGTTNTIDNDVNSLPVPVRRQAQWKYLIPVATAPLAHWVVTLQRRAPQSKRKLIFSAVAAVTLGAVATRLILMADAGYPGAERDKDRDSRPT